jgi:hypothetical protein
MAKYAIFAFNGNPMCFVHVLLNALDLAGKGHEVRIIMEGEAVKLVRDMTESQNPQFQQAREAGLIDCICRACSYKMGVLEYNEASGIPLRGEMSGHPPFSSYMEEGFELITL